MKRFWIDDNFVRNDAKNLTVYQQTVFLALSCHVNRFGETFIGCRKIGELLNINKNTVNKAINGLIAYGCIRRLERKNGRSSILKIITVSNEQAKPYQSVIHKEDNKELIKEDNFEDNKRRSSNLQMIRNVLEERNLKLKK